MCKCLSESTQTINQSDNQAIKMSSFHRSLVTGHNTLKRLPHTPVKGHFGTLVIHYIFSIYFLFCFYLFYSLFMLPKQNVNKI